MDQLKDIEVNNDGAAKKITGKSYVDHSIRVKLGLNCNEFIVMQFLEEKKSIVSKDVVYSSIGMSMNEFNSYILSLNFKGYLKNHEITELWNKAFAVDMNEFNQLWKLFNKKGNKETALSRFKQVIKRITFEELFLRAQTYQTNVSHRSLEHRLGLDTYLTPDKKRWMDSESTPIKNQLSNVKKFFK